MDEIKLVKRIPKSDESPLGCEYVTDKNVFDRPTVLVLSGGETNSSKTANYAAKMSQMLLTGDKTKFPKDIQFISTEYPKSYDKDKRNVVLSSLTKNDNFCTPEVEEIFKKFFLPLLADNIRIADDNVEMDKLGLEEIKRRFRNLNIVAYSHGGAIAEQLGDTIRYYMQKIGYNEEETKQAMQEISLLTIGNVADIERNKNHFTALHIINERDNIVAERGNNLDKAERYVGSKGTTDLDEEGRKILAFQITDNLLEVAEDNGSDVAYEFSTHERKHALDSHVNFSYKENSGVMEAVPSYASRFLAASVNNSVNNQKKHGDFMELPTAQILLAKTPFQTRLLKKKFDRAIESTHNM